MTITTLIRELNAFGDVRRLDAILTVDSAGYHMRDQSNIFSKFRHDLPLDTSPERLEAHWEGFVANVNANL